MRKWMWMVVVACFSVSAWSIEADKVPESKRTPLGLYLTSKEAYDMKKEKGDAVFFVDVRSKAEAVFLGMPTVADALLPLEEFNGESAPWNDKGNAYSSDMNLDFVPQMDALLKSKGLDKHATIVLMCRSGSRSALATGLLAKYGYDHIYSVIDGYEGDVVKEGPQAGQRAVNGWRNAGLPWSYKLDLNKMPKN
jgi:rhodanese-related sulfurtransferase